MAHTLTIYTTRYGPWQDDERGNLGTDTIEVAIEPEEDETLADAVHNELSSRGITSYSDEGTGVDGSGHGWFYDPDGYDDPYEDTREEYSAHLSEDFTPAERQAVFNRTVLLQQPPIEGVKPMTDAQARVIASQYQSSGYEGAALVALSSSGFISRHTEHDVDMAISRHGKSEEEYDNLRRLKSYVRTKGVRGVVPGWSNLWDDDFEKFGDAGAPMPPSTVGMPELFGSGSEVRVRPGKGWGRKEYEDLAEFIATRPDRELLGRFFAAELRGGDNPRFDVDRFIEACDDHQYRVRRGTAHPQYARGKLNFLAEAARVYDADYENANLTTDLADHLQRRVPRFNRSRFLTAAHYTEPIPEPTMPRDDTPDFDGIQRAFQIARAEHGLPPTSEDGPRDATQPSPERTTRMTQMTGEFAGYTQAVEQSKALVAWLEEAVPQIENFVGSITTGEMDGPVLTEANLVGELIAQAKTHADNVLAEMEGRGAVFDARSAQNGKSGSQEFFENQ